MDSLYKVQLSGKGCDINKTEKNLQNFKTKDKMNTSKKISNKVKKHKSMFYIDDEKDKDVILRMVLPGYNWFEDQIKNNMYTADGEKKKISGNASSNPKQKISNTTKVSQGPIISKNIETLLKQKSALSKRVINSTLMLLPNNSLPLKKRKIKKELKDTECILEVISSDDMEIEVKEPVCGQTQVEAKRMYNPPIQKVIPILNNYKSLDVIPTEIKFHENIRPSAFKSDHLQKKYSYHSNANNSQHIYISNNFPEYNLQHTSMMNKPLTYPVPEINNKFQAPYQTNSNFCHQCNALRLQSSQFNKHSNHNCYKPTINYQPTQDMLSQKSYWPGNYYPMYNSYDPLAIPETSQAYTRTYKSTKPLETLTTYGTRENPFQIDQMPLNYPNGNTQPYCHNLYWNNQNPNPFKPVQMNPIRNSNFLNSVNTVPMQHQQQYFFKEFNPNG